MSDKPSNAAMRAAEKLIFISGLDSGIDRVAKIIDQETGLKELIEAAEITMRKDCQGCREEWPIPDEIWHEIPGTIDSTVGCKFNLLRATLARAKGET